MLHAGLKPSLVTYNTLLDVYAKRGAWQEALAVLDALQRRVRRGGTAGAQYWCTASSGQRREVTCCSCSCGAGRYWV